MRDVFRPISLNRVSVVDLNLEALFRPASRIERRCENRCQTLAPARGITSALNSKFLKLALRTDPV